MMRARRSSATSRRRRTATSPSTAGFSPFIGAGLDAGGWSFALNATRGKETFGAPAEPQPFTLDELYGHVDEAIESLGLPGLSVGQLDAVDGPAYGLQVTGVQRQGAAATVEAAYAIRAANISQATGSIRMHLVRADGHVLIAWMTITPD
jgi:hypothetical protein